MSEIYPLEVTPDRPEFELLIDGEPLDPELRVDVMEIDIHAEIGRHGRAAVLLQNWNPDTQEVRHSDDPPLPLGGTVEIKLGYHSTVESVFVGTVTGFRLHFPRDGGPTVEVQLRTKSILLDAVRRSRVLEDEATDSSLAETIASDHGLSADVGEGFDQPVVVSVDRTDWSWLTDRADSLGWVTYVAGDELVFRPAAEPDEPTTLTWALNLIELELTQDASAVIDQVIVAGWDSEALAPIETELAGDDGEFDRGDRSGAGSTASETGWPSRTEHRTTTLGVASAELDRTAAARTNRAEGHLVNGRGRTIGLPQLRIDTWLDITGVGTRVAGPHYLSAVRHRLGTHGFHTEFQLGRPPRLTPPTAISRGGLEIGVVESLDDPLEWGRVKVGFPWRTDAPDPIWARLATADAGPESGTLFVPDVGHEVVVGRIGSDDRFPVVLGSLWNGQAPLPETIDPEKNDIRAIVSRSGHRVVFNDGDDALLQVVTDGGHQVLLDDANGALVLSEMSGNNSITIDDSGITLDAGSGDVIINASGGSVAIDATQFDAKASGGATVESSATLDVKASATLGLSGALVNINS